jgi:hypothetical protein
MIVSEVLSWLRIGLAIVVLAFWFVQLVLVGIFAVNGVAQNSLPMIGFAIVLALLLPFTGKVLGFIAALLVR